MKHTINLYTRAIKLYNKIVPGHMLLEAITKLLQAIIPAVVLFFSARIINELLGTGDTDAIIRYVIITVGISFVFAVIGAVLSKYINTSQSLSYNAFNQLLGTEFSELSYDHAENAQTHQLVNDIRDRASNGGMGLMRIRQYTSHLASGTFGIVASLALLVGMFNTLPATGASWVTHPASPLAIVVLVLILFALRTFFSKSISMYSTMYFAQFAKANTEYYYYAARDSGYIHQAGKEVRLYNQYNLIMEADKKRYRAFHKYAHVFFGTTEGAAAAVAAIFSGAVYMFIGLRALHGMYSIGSVVQYVGAITLLSTHLSGVVTTLAQIKIDQPHIELLYKFLDLPKQEMLGNIPVEKRTDNEYEIEFRNVSFKYPGCMGEQHTECAASPGSEQYALKNFSIKFRIGQRLAIVGMNGSGKTTMIKLLCRLYNPTEGEITLNGIDIHKYRFHEYMAIFSVVFQDFGLFGFTLGQNVATNVNYNAAKVTECLAKTSFDGETFGLDTHLNKEFDDSGINISGGEAQKIALARAIYKNAPFIVLDEPTAALDPIAEYEIYSKFNEIVGEKTAIYISHRLSSCKFCDDIAVFHEGELVQRGRHEELLVNTSGKYYELWNAQAQYYSEA